MNKAVFLDRDGVINIDKSYLYKIDDFEFCNGIFRLLLHLEKLDHKLFIVTNQSGIGRGYYNENDFLKLTFWMLKKFNEKNIHIEKVYYCPHSPDDGCDCRKPNSGMFENAQEEFNIDMSVSWMIGDKKSDIQAAKKAGIKQTIFINNFTCEESKYNVNSLFDIIDIIKN